MRPLVSVLIDTYNHDRYIEQAIVSAIEQDFPANEYEILVVDDGSTDRTPEIVQKFAPRVRLLRKTNGGQASAFNLGIRESRGEIVAFLDGDDWFAPGKLLAAMDALERHPEAAAAGHGYYEFYEETKELRTRVPSEPKFLQLSTPQVAREASRSWLFLLPSALAIRKKALDRIMPLPEALVFCADGPIHMAAMAGGAYVLTEPLCYYRQHSANLRMADSENAARLRRGLEMNELALEMSLPVLAQLGVRSDSAQALIYPALFHLRQQKLSLLRGSRLEAFQTEMRRFHFDFEKPSVGYRLFKYLIVGSASLVLPPRVFYRVRNWYARLGLGRFRNRIIKQT